MKRAALFVRINELVIDNRVVIPLVNRPTVGAASNKLRMTVSGWDTDTPGCSRTGTAEPE